MASKVSTLPAVEGSPRGSMEEQEVLTLTLTQESGETRPAAAVPQRQSLGVPLGSRRPPTASVAWETGVGPAQKLTDP